MSSQTILSLSAIISENTLKIHEYLVANGLPTPSFDVDGPTESLIPAEAQEIQAARVAVVDATEKLRRLTLGPRDYLMSFIADELISMQAISRFNIVTSFPVHEEASFAQIAKQCDLDESITRRLIRQAINKDIFSEPRKGVVAHNAVSRLLAEDKQLLSFVSVNTDELWQAGSQAINAMVKWPGSQEPNETGFALANNTTASMYEFFSQHPERAQRFASSMESYTVGTGYSVDHVVHGYDWASIGAGTVVDVGGSHGFICKALAKTFPSLKFVVQDLEMVLESADKSASPRTEFMAHNFLTEQPVKHADVYLFRWIFHNWSDKYCIQILRNHIPALKHNARIIIVDNVLPEPGTLPMWQEARLRSMDLTIMEIQNSKERDLDEWAKLFEEADPRFKFQGGKLPQGSHLWILEAIWEQE